MRFASIEREWFVGALRNFGEVWGDMTPENRGLLMRTLVASIVVNEATGMCRVKFVDLGTDEGTKEAA